MVTPASGFFLLLLLLLFVFRREIERFTQRSAVARDRVRRRDGATATIKYSGETGEGGEGGTKQNKTNKRRKKKTTKQKKEERIIIIATSTCNYLAIGRRDLTLPPFGSWRHSAQSTSPIYLLFIVYCALVLLSLVRRTRYWSTYSRHLFICWLLSFILIDYWFVCYSLFMLL